MNAELYELVGAGWSLPITVTWISSSQAEIRKCDIPMLKRQSELLEGELRARATHREGDVWFLNKLDLDKIAMRSTVTDPEDVVVWNSPECDWKVDLDFIDAYCESRDAIVRNPKYFILLWASACKFALEWVLLHQKPLDLGFARVEAFCARAAFKNNAVAHLTAIKGNKVLTPEQSRRELRRFLHQSAMVAYDETTKTVRWTLEIVPSKQFHDTAEMVEIKRKRNSRMSYLAQVLAFLKSPSHKNRIFEVVIRYMRELQYRFPALPHGFKSDATKDPNSEIELSPTPKWQSAPVVLGGSIAAGTARLKIKEDEMTLTPEDLRNLPQLFRAA
jgi:hypothetical protein